MTTHSIHATERNVNQSYFALHLTASLLNPLPSSLAIPLSPSPFHLNLLSFLRPSSHLTFVDLSVAWGGQRSLLLWLRCLLQQLPELLV